MPDYQGGGYDRGGYRSEGTEVPAWKLYSIAHKPGGWAVTGSTSELTLGEVMFNGDLLGENGIVRVTGIVAMTNNANTKALKVKYATGVGAITILDASIASNGCGRFLAEFVNRNSAQDQISGCANIFAGYGVGGQTHPVGTARTMGPKLIAVTALLGNAADIVTLHAWRVEFMRID